LRLRVDDERASLDRSGRRPRPRGLAGPARLDRIRPPRFATSALSGEDVRVGATGRRTRGRARSTGESASHGATMMRRHHPRSPSPVLAALAGVLVVEVVARVVSNYPRYLPPDFSAEFLHGRERQFLGPYPLAFYVHILSGPISLILGLALV